MSTSSEGSNRSVVPDHRIRLCQVRQSFERDRASILESKLLAHTELTDGDRDGDVARLSSVAQPRGQLYRGAEQVVVVVGDRLPGADANAHRERCRRSLVALMERGLNGDGERDRAAHRGEGGHDAVAGVLDLSSVVVYQCCPDD